MKDFMPSNLLESIPCTAFQVLNPWEQTLYNLCEEYFYLRQSEKNRHCVLSQVRLVDAIKVGAVKDGKDTPYINGVQFTALSFDILVTNSEAKPRFVFEADGATHGKEPQLSRDVVKDAIVEKAGLHLFRLEVEGMHPPLAVVHAEATKEHFSRDKVYTDTTGPVCYSEANFPDCHRLLDMADIELRLIRVGWIFPAGWAFVTGDTPG
jgi:hypothetical protein